MSPKTPKWILWWWAFLLLYVIQQAYCGITSVCSDLKTGANLANFQGLSAIHGALYLVVSDRVYKIPMTEQFVRDGRFGLFPNTQDLGLWQRLPSLFNVSLPDQSKLERLTFFVYRTPDGSAASTSESQILASIWAQKYAILYFGKSGSTFVDFTPLLYGLVGDGTGARNYLFRYDYSDQTVPSVVVDPEPLIIEPDTFDGRELNLQIPTVNYSLTIGYPYYYILLHHDTNQQVEFLLRQFQERPQDGAQLLTNPWVAGFITTDGTVHLWDFVAKQVYLFQDPGLKRAQDPLQLQADLKESSSGRVPFKNVPFSQYFFCSQDEFDSSELPEMLSGNKTSSGLWIWITIVAVFLVAFVGLCLMIRRRRRANRFSKASGVSKASTLVWTPLNSSLSNSGSMLQSSEASSIESSNLMSTALNAKASTPKRPVGTGAPTKTKMPKRRKTPKISSNKVNQIRSGRESSLDPLGSGFKKSLLPITFESNGSKLSSSGIQSKIKSKLPSTSVKSTSRKSASGIESIIQNASSSRTSPDNSSSQASNASQIQESTSRDHQGSQLEPKALTPSIADMLKNIKAKPSPKYSRKRQ